jgi:transmembrane sensor
MNQRDYLFQKWLENTATTEELDELARIIAQDGYSEDDELFQQFVKELGAKKTISEADRRHAIDTFQSRWNKQGARSEKEAVPMHRSNRYVWWSAAAVILVAIGVAWFVGNFKENKTSDQLAFTPVPDTTIIITTGNNSKFVVLPDNSTVLLNANSSITYTKRYGFDTREVTLTGEGFFDVMHNPFTPFKVRTGKLVTNVLGTAFNIKVVKAASGGDHFTVTVSRGKVAVSDDHQTYGTITPNEQIDLNTNDDVFTRSKVNAAVATAWTNQFLVFNNLSLEDVIAILSERFHMKIVLENRNIRDCKITSAFLDKPKLETVLNVVTALVDATYSFNNKNGNVTISGGECK